MMSKAVFIFMLLSVRALPASGLSGIRRKAWRDLAVGACGERENLSLRCQGRSANPFLKSFFHRNGIEHTFAAVKTTGLYSLLTCISYNNHKLMYCRLL